MERNGSEIGRTVSKMKPLTRKKVASNAGSLTTLQPSKNARHLGPRLMLISMTHSEIALRLRCRSQH